MLIFQSVTPQLASLGLSAALRNSGWLFALYKRIQMWNRDRLRRRRQHKLESQLQEQSDAQTGLLSLFETNFNEQSESFCHNVALFGQHMDKLFADQLMSIQQEYNAASSCASEAEMQALGLQTDVLASRARLLAVTERLFNTKLNVHQAKLERSLSDDLSKSIQSSFASSNLALTSHESSITSLEDAIEVATSQAKEESEKLDVIVQKMAKIARRLSTSQMPREKLAIESPLPAPARPTLSISA